MSLTSLFLVILASLIHATWNLLAKKAANVGAVFVFAYNLFSVVAFAPWVLFLVATGHLGLSGKAAVFMLLAGFIHLAYSLCLQQGYKVADLSVVYPVARGSGPMLSTIGAILILGEAPRLIGLVGLVLVVGGIGLIATQGNLGSVASTNSCLNTIFDIVN
jgi:drug/metabolite transporter (DMT)-like permease